MKHLIAAVMNKSHLLSVCIIFASLAGFTQSASATTLFGLNFDFGSQGDGWLQFEVDPDNLPFDQWIDLTTVTGLEAQFTIVDSFNHPLGTVRLTDSSLVEFAGSVFITNINPLFPVELSSNFLFDFRHTDFGPITDDTVVFIHLTPTVVTMGLENESRFFDFSNSFSYSTVTVWFDGPVPAVVPIPAAVWLFGSGLGFLAWVRRRQTA